MLRQRLMVTLVTVLVPTVVLAQDPQSSPDDQKPAATQQESTQKKEDQPPAAVGEAQAAKPTRGFFSALFHNLGDDVKHMPRMNSVYWLAGGAALAAIVHPEDHKVNARLVNSTTNSLWIPGKVIGGLPTILGASFATYMIGRSEHMNRLQHLGMDEIEAAILSEELSKARSKLAGATVRSMRTARSRQASHSRRGTAPRHSLRRPCCSSIWAIRPEFRPT